MSLNPPRLVLVTPVLSDVEGFRAELTEAFTGGGIASLILRLGPADERTLVNRVKALAPIAQAQDAAVLVHLAGDHADTHDAAQIATRGGADGIHVEDPAELRRLRERYRDSHIIGAGAIYAKHDAMQAGEAGADYVLFGDPDLPAGSTDLETLCERAHWWAEIFEVPCIALAPSLAAVPRIIETGTEFLGLGDAVWTHVGGPGAALAAVRPVLETRETAPS